MEQAAMTLEIIALANTTDDAATAWLPRAEAAHRQLRANLPPGHDAYRESLARIFADGGQLCLATENNAVKGLALWRVAENTHPGRHLYVEDLVTDAACRSAGVGKALIHWLEDRARALSCAALTLDSGVARKDAHRFYFREGFHIPAFHFRKELA
ncbi:MAG: GNAT family N-acetyltransferase [Zoogloeaceae bacterium]|jgi:GNAT superfamily N-acetyltransferase|nr:GNAT family N-acetyltransferase [Zoogloeaceae bacterium]